MSRILRRPMFRGGGTVDSYGMGITAPLVPGYRMGGNIRGGIVDLPGGYNETANERFIKSLTKDFGVPSAAISGGSTVNLPQLTLGSDLYPSGAVAPRSVNVPGVEETGKSEVIEDIDFSGMDSDFDQTETVTVPDGKGGTKEIRAYKDQSEIEPSPIVKLNMPFSDYDREDYNRDMKKIETDKIQERLDAESDGVTGKGGGADMGGMSVSEIEDLGTGTGEGEGEETTELNAKDAIAANQKLFAELLGSDKARGQDIGDMLLRFSGSGGNTLGEKFQNYVRAESAAGPSRSEKIKQTAAGLAINDYVAGKRAKEQGELLTKKIDYELDAKERKLTPQADDSNTDILRKIATAYKIEPNSNKAIKALLKFRTGRSDVFAITADPMDKKLLKKLEIGINIVTHKGTKTIIEKISDTEAKVLPFSGI